MLVGELVALDSELSEHLVEPAELLAWDTGLHRRGGGAICARAAGLEKGTSTHCKKLTQYASAAKQRRELAELVAAYRVMKRELDAIDFGDQVSLAARLAEQVPEVGAAERAAAGVVLLDEYQDTSVAQRRLLVGLFGGGHPVTAVGDPCQAIYGWRGASVSNLDDVPAALPLACRRSRADVYSLVGQPALRRPAAAAGQQRRRRAAAAARGRGADAAAGEGRAGRRPGRAARDLAARSASGSPTRSRRRTRSTALAARSPCWSAPGATSPTCTPPSSPAASRSRWSGSAACCRCPRSPTSSPPSR